MPVPTAKQPEARKSESVKPENLRFSGFFCG